MSDLWAVLPWWVRGILRAVVLFALVYGVLLAVLMVGGQAGHGG